MLITTTYHTCTLRRKTGVEDFTYSQFPKCSARSSQVSNPSNQAFKQTLCMLVQYELFHKFVAKASTNEDTDQPDHCNISHQCGLYKYSAHRVAACLLSSTHIYCPALLSMQIKRNL